MANYRAPQPMSQAAMDLGMGEQLKQQLAAAEEEKKKKMMMQANNMTDIRPGTMALFGIS